MQKPNPPPTDAEQSKRFIETAKALGVDDDSKNFAQAIGVVMPLRSKKTMGKRSSGISQRKIAIVK